MGVRAPMSKGILVVTNRSDLHADIVIKKIAQSSAPTFRLNLDEFPRSYTITLTLSHGDWRGELTYIPTGESMCVSEVGAVWMRKSAPFSFRSDGLSPQERTYADEETTHILFGMLYSCDCYWMSHPRAIRGALWKGEQLRRAARMGFRIPASLISNRPDSVAAFAASSSTGMVFKALSSPALCADKVAVKDRIVGSLPTTLITDEHEEMLSAVSELPCFFQHYVPKRHELRVTVIGETVFAAEIHSQDDIRTAIDFRDFSAEIPYRVAELPLEIERRCRDFVHSYQLDYGALDLILTPEGEYVFLENNPAGQFLFVEQLVPELRMTDVLAERLIAGARRQPG